MAGSTQSDRRKLIIIVVVMVCIATNITVEAKEPEWFAKLKQIDILKSRSADVERVFSDSKVVDQIDYQTKRGYLEVEYSTGGALVTNSSLRMTSH